MESEMRGESRRKPLDVEDDINDGFYEEKVAPAKRIVAFVVDLAASMIIALIPYVGGIAGAIYLMLRDALRVEIFSVQNLTDLLNDRLIMENVEERSLGKVLFGLTVMRYGDPNAKINYTTSIKRNWMFAFGPLSLSFLSIPGIGWLPALVSAILFLCLLYREIRGVFYEEKGRRAGDIVGGTVVTEE